MKSILTAAAAVVLLASCGAGINLSGKWEIVKLNGEEVQATETKPFLEFNTEKSEVHGNTSCNIMNGSYTQDGKKLSFGNMATTMMAGPDMDLEREVLDAMNKTASIKDVAGDNIQVFDENGNLIMELHRK